MPYASLAQARKFHADPKLRKYTSEFDAATDFSKLPAHVKPRKKHHERSGIAEALAKR